MGVIAFVAAVAIGVWLVRRLKRNRSADLRAEITQELEAYPSVEEKALIDPAVAAVVALLLETETSHRALSPAEFDALTAHFRDRWHLAQAGASLTPDAARDIVQVARAHRTRRGDGPGSPRACSGKGTSPSAKRGSCSAWRRCSASRS